MPAGRWEEQAVRVQATETQHPGTLGWFFWTGIEIDQLLVGTSVDSQQSQIASHSRKCFLLPRSQFSHAPLILAILGTDRRSADERHLGYQTPIDALGITLSQISPPHI